MEHKECECKCLCNKDIEVKVKRISKDIPLPKYSIEDDACMDLCILVNDDEAKINSGLAFIGPGETKIFDTGLVFVIPKGYDMKIYPRSSTGIKVGVRLCNSVGILDCGYLNTCKVALHNFSKKTITVEHLQRVAQFQVKPFPKMRIVEVDEVGTSERNLGGIGSTGII